MSSSFSQQEVQELESLQFQKVLKNESNVLLLDEAGKEMDSIGFSKYMETKIRTGGHSICIVIGGAFGFSSSMKQKYKDIVSLSKLTFAHHLARTVLLEQIYRAFTIMNNEPYHNS